MPRVDEGVFVVEINSVLDLDWSSIKALTRWAISTGACLVVEPSIAFLRAPRSSRILPLAIGVGSLVAKGEPPPPTKYYVVERTFWVNCLKTGVNEPNYRVLEGVKKVVEGTIISIDIRDPVALLVNGLQGVHVVNIGAKTNCTPLATIGDTIVLCRVNKGYATTLIEGEAAKRIEYMATLFTTTVMTPSPSF
jgi:hypothetical protein